MVRWELIAATTSGLFRSTDHGNCWYTLLGGVGIVWDEDYRSASPRRTSDFSPFAAGSAVYGRLATGTAVHYGVIAMSGGTASQIAVSTNQGQSWTARPTPCSKQCDAFPAVVVDPRDDRVVYYGEVSPRVSTDSGQTFTSLGTTAKLHPDQHDFLIDAGGNLLVATDGGVFSIRLSAAGQPLSDWTPVNLGLQTNQSSTLSLTANDPSAVAMGSWDNGTKRRELGQQWIGYQGDGDGDGSAIGKGASDPVYFAHANALFGSSVVRKPDGVAEGIGVGFRTNPYKPEQLWLLGGADGGDARNRLFLSLDAGTAATPTRRCVDPSLSFAITGGVSKNPVRDFK